MHTLARDTPEDVGRSLGDDGLELGGTLDEQVSRKAERVDVDIDAVTERLRPAVRDDAVHLTLSRKDVHVSEREQHIVRRRARRVACRVPHGRDAQVEQFQERLHQRRL